MERILICWRCKFGEYISYNSKDIKFFLAGYFLARLLVPTAERHHAATDTVSLLENFEDDPFRHS